MPRIPSYSRELIDKARARLVEHATAPWLAIDPEPITAYGLIAGQTYCIKHNSLDIHDQLLWGVALFEELISRGMLPGQATNKGSDKEQIEQARAHIAHRCDGPLTAFVLISRATEAAQSSALGITDPEIWANALDDELRVRGFLAQGVIEVPGS